MLDINEIMEFLPHRYPFLLIDRVLDFDPDKRVVGIKNTTINEPFFQGHFPGKPVMPGVLIVEAMAQLSGILLLAKPETKGKIAYFAAMTDVRFRVPVVPGDQIRLEVDFLKFKGPIGKTSGKAFVDGQLVAEAKMTFSLADREITKLIDPTAQIHASADIGRDVVIGPHVTIGEGVQIGNGVIIEANAVVEKWVSIGEESHIHYGAIIGNATQDKKYAGDRSYVEIGKRNDIREYVTINRATEKEGKTVLGDDNLLLTHVHIAHDCVVGSNVVFSNAAQVAGHVIIEDRAIIGGLAGITQFCRIGKQAMVGGYSKVNQDVPPFMLVEGNPATIRTLNAIGLERNGSSKSDVRAMKEAYKLLFRSKLNTTQALEKVSKEITTTAEIEHLAQFLKAKSHNGIMKKDSK